MRTEGDLPMSRLVAIVVAVGIVGTHGLAQSRDSDRKAARELVSNSKTVAVVISYEVTSPATDEVRELIAYGVRKICSERGLVMVSDTQQADLLLSIDRGRAEFLGESYVDAKNSVRLDGSMTGFRITGYLSLGTPGQRLYRREIRGQAGTEAPRAVDPLAPASTRGPVMAGGEERESTHSFSSVHHSLQGPAVKAFLEEIRKTLGPRSK